MDEHNPKSIGEALRRCKQSVIAVGLFSGVLNLLMLTPAFFMLNIYDKALASNSLDTLFVLTILAAVMFFVMAALDAIRGRVLVHISTRLDRLLAPDIYKRLFDVARSLGGLQSSQPLRDLESIRQFLTGNGLVALFDAPWIPIYIAILFLFHPLLGWIGICAAITFLALALLNERTTTPALIVAAEGQRAVNLNLQRNLKDTEVVSAMGMLGPMEAKWRDLQERVIGQQEVGVRRSKTFTAVVKTLRLAVQSIALAAGAYLALKQEISPGMVIAGSILVGRALQPVEVAISSWRSFVDCWQQVSRLDKLLSDITLPSPKMTLPRITGRVTAKEAELVAPGVTPSIVARQLNFDVPAGSVVMVIGASGAGKSSLIRGVLGLWRTCSGAITLDGAEADKFDRSNLGPQLGYLPQDIELMEGSVSANIARFSEVDPEAVVLAAKDAGVHELVLSLPDGYDTMLHQTGAILSPGQQQRIALARALYRRPKLVVLDEPNSNLDTDGDEALYDAIQMLKSNGSTVFVVSHRENIFPIVDYLMVMANGYLADFGPSSEVISRNKKRNRPDPPVANKDTPALVTEKKLPPKLEVAKFSVSEPPPRTSMAGGDDE